MRPRILTSLAAALLLAYGLWAASLAAQTPSGTKSFDPTATNTEAAIKAAADAARTAAAARANWTPPRTPWGDPDLRGYYLSLSYTPLERPAALADKPFYTEQEAIAAFRKAVESDAEVDPRTVHYDWKEYGMDAWQSPIRPNLRTALIVDPPNGRIPPQTPEARQRLARAGRGNDVRNRKSSRRPATSSCSCSPTVTRGSFRSMAVRTSRRRCAHGLAIRVAGGRATRSSSRRPTSTPSGNGVGPRPACT
jgi:hypothetical protein